MRGQMQLMEYMFLAFIVIVLLVGVVFFIIGWEVSTIQIEQKKGIVSDTLALTKIVSNNKLFVQKDSLFDDAKLTAALRVVGTCEQLTEVFGPNSFVEVSVFDPNPPKDCSTTNYPACNRWRFCAKPENNVSFVLPVNVYRTLGFVTSTGVNGRTDLGLLKVGYYVS